ncbi:hypothetical protein JW906_14960 [bacterium]|nr:hypothetical protein [bacterium]
MRSSLRILVMFLTVHSFSFAQENSLKDIYTEITTRINSALLTRKSSVELSGFISYQYYKTRYDEGITGNRYSFQVDPIVSYFIIKNLSLGLSFSYHYDKIEAGTTDQTDTIDQKFLGPVVKYYFCNEKFRPFLFADYLFLAGDHLDGGELGLGAGIMIHVSGNLGLNFQVKYGQIWSDQEGIDSQNLIFAGIGLSHFIF